MLLIFKDSGLVGARIGTRPYWSTRLGLAWPKEEENTKENGLYRRLASVSRKMTRKVVQRAQLDPRDKQGKG